MLVCRQSNCCCLIKPRRRRQRCDEKWRGRKIVSSCDDPFLPAAAANSNCAPWIMAMVPNHIQREREKDLIIIRDNLAFYANFIHDSSSKEAAARCFWFYQSQLRVNQVCLNSLLKFCIHWPWLTPQSFYTAAAEAHHQLHCNHTLQLFAIRHSHPVLLLAGTSLVLRLRSFSEGWQVVNFNSWQNWPHWILSSFLTRWSWRYALIVIPASHLWKGFFSYNNNL